MTFFPVFRTSILLKEIVPDIHGIRASDFVKWRVPCCFYLAEKVEDLDKAVGLELW